MIIFSDKYTEKVGRLQETLDSLGVDSKVSVLEDDAFLPKGIFSPYEYYIAKQNHEEHAERELFYDALSVPEYWETRDNGENVCVYDVGSEQAKVYFHKWGTEQSSVREHSEGVGGVLNNISVRVAKNGKIIAESAKEKGVVQHVEWHTEDGWIFRVDFYNKFGLRYASEFRDADGNVDSKVFYSDENREVIVEQPGNNVVTLVENGVVKALFNSRKEFLEQYVIEVSSGERLALFVQDEKMLESLPVNPEGEQAWECAYFPNDELLNKYRNVGGKNGFRFFEIPTHYPENKARGEALILTMSDQIERIEELTCELPEMTFHIAANTLVSDKLERLGERENAHIYPCVSREKLDELWERCDFYLDINHWWEIYDAVNVAHQNNLLIMGFENTMHHQELLVKGCRFLEQDYKKMVLVIKYVMKSPELMQKLLLVQQRKVKAVWKERLKSGEERKQEWES